MLSSLVGSLFGWGSSEYATQHPNWVANRPAGYEPEAVIPWSLKERLAFPSFRHFSEFSGVPTLVNECRKSQRRQGTVNVRDWVNRHRLEDDTC